MQSFDLKCEVKRSTWDYVGETAYCIAQNVNITTRNEDISSVNGQTGSLTGLLFRGQTVHYLPKGINNFFPNLTVLQVQRSKLKSLTQDDLKSLTQLINVGFSHNDLGTLGGDLFEFNTKLKFVSFHSNKLKYIGDNLMSNLPHLQYGSFEKNTCIDVRAESSSEIPVLLQKLKSECKWPQDPVFVKEIDQLKNKTNEQMIDLSSRNLEIIALKDENTRQGKAHEIQHGKDEDSMRQLNVTIGKLNSEIIQLREEIADQAKLLKACEIQHRKDEDSIELLNGTNFEMKSKLDIETKVVASLQKDNAKSKRWLKSCDGILNAVIEILFNSSEQNFTQPYSKLLVFIVEIDGSKVTASELVISSPGSMIKSVKNANGFDVNIVATELHIDHQQTLFLPTNLGQCFPSIEVLVVTSSGLMQIDPRIFGLIQNLKVLNLNSNKLQEIQPGTFDQHKLLESLDLSSNNLKTFEARAIIALEKLKNLNLAGNRLKSISPNIFEPLKVLQSADLSNNDCIDLSYPNMTLDEIKDQLVEECTAPVEIDCFTLGPDDNGSEKIQEEEFDCKAVGLTIVHPKIKISKLKNQIDSDSFTFSIINQHIAFLPFQLSKTFTNLHILVVVRSKLTALNQRDLEGLTNLKNITIVNNNILLIEPGVFDDVPQLEHLNLSSNHIQTLPATTFVKLVKLKTLNLSRNRLQSFFSEILPSNNVIEELHIENNKLQKISSTISSDLEKVKIIDLTNNTCIDFKYEKDKTGSKSLPELFKALQDCPM